MAGFCDIVSVYCLLQYRNVINTDPMGPIVGVKNGSDSNPWDTKGFQKENNRKGTRNSSYTNMGKPLRNTSLLQNIV